MSVTFTITGSSGIFSPGPAGDPNNPLFSRSYEYIRTNDQAPAYRKVLLNFSGFFEGDSSEEIINQYNTLSSILKDNDVLMTLSVGSESILPVAQRVYVSGYNEPEDWKEYDGSYSFSVYYFDTSFNNLITASYVTSSGTYNFDPTPSWQRRIKQNRNIRGVSVGPSGVEIGSTANINLSGHLQASTHAALKTKIDSLESAFSKDGTLNYGGFSESVRVGEINIPEVFPEKVVQYNISLQYDIGSLVSLSTETRYSRIHSNPVIKEKFSCDERIIKLLGTSGQFISYRMKIESEDIITARNLLAVEADNYVISGGIEMPGGEEIWSDDDNSVEVNLTKFHNVPVLANLPGT